MGTTVFEQTGQWFTVVSVDITHAEPESTARSLRGAIVSAGLEPVAGRPIVIDTGAHRIRAYVMHAFSESDDVRRRLMAIRAPRSQAPLRRVTANRFHGEWPMTRQATFPQGDDPAGGARVSVAPR